MPEILLSTILQQSLLRDSFFGSDIFAFQVNFFFT